MDELACFAPGMIALGSSGYGPDDSQKFMSLAEEVCFNRAIWKALMCLFCWLTYFSLDLSIY